MGARPWTSTTEFFLLLTSDIWFIDPHRGKPLTCCDCDRHHAHARCSEINCRRLPVRDACFFGLHSPHYYARGHRGAGAPRHNGSLGSIPTIEIETKTTDTSRPESGVGSVTLMQLVVDSCLGSDGRIMFRTTSSQVQGLATWPVPGFTKA